MLLAEAQEATGDRAAALATYARVAAAGTAKEKASGLLGQGRLLAADGKWDEARGPLEQALDAGDGAVAQDAADMYMTAAYLTSDSPWARRALVGAGQAFAALKQNDAAVIVYRKLLATNGVEPDLAEAARRGLRALGAS